MFCIHAHGLLAKIARTRRWRFAHYGRHVMGTSVFPRKHRFPDVYSDVYSGVVP